MFFFLRNGNVHDREVHPLCLIARPGTSGHLWIGSRPPRPREFLGEVCKGHRATSTIMSPLLSQFRASHLKIPSPPFSKGPPGGTPSGPRLRALRASTLCAPSPSRPPRSLRSSQALKFPGLRAIPFGGAAAGTCPGHSRWYQPSSTRSPASGPSGRQSPGHRA